MKLALCNIPIIWERLDLNLEYCEKVCDTLQNLDSGVELILFPEFFTYGFTVDSSLCEVDNGDTLSWMKMSSERLNAAIYASVPVKTESGLFNRGYFVKPDGKVINYDKRHLFTYGGEDKRFSPGEERVVVNHNGWRILLQICYDLRFPVWSRNINLDYDLALNVASWPSSRSSVIRNLVAARAIENQSFYAFLNRSGCDPLSDYSGESFIYSWSGDIIEPVLQYSELNISLYEIKKEKLLSNRESFPAWRDADKFKIIK